MGAWQHWNFILDTNLPFPAEYILLSVGIVIYSFVFNQVSFIWDDNIIKFDSVVRFYFRILGAKILLFIPPYLPKLLICSDILNLLIKICLLYLVVIILKMQPPKSPSEIFENLTDHRK